ncbi:MAG TPA: DNA polymerase III subunit delta' [Cyanobacteria bacterium UBA11368]|nr:DNA polymerase III subunit delta' [Cyanobacteria bacterium UBA11368]
MSILQFFPDPGNLTDTTGIAEKATFEPYFDAIAGQSTAIKLLHRAVSTNNLPNAYLFAGIDGVGKRMTARGFIKALFCHSLPTEKADNCLDQIELGKHPDVLWIEPTYIHNDNIIPVSMAIREQLTFKQPPQIRSEQIREIDRFLAHLPITAPRQVVVIEQVELMATKAASALLKTLEEPGQATFILIASNAELLLPTIRSRCSLVPFRSLSYHQMERVLETTGHQEVLKQPEIVMMAQGSPGRAIASWHYFQKIDPSFLNPPLNQSLVNLLATAKTICQKLDLATQQWLLEYWQYQLWKTQKNREISETLSNAKKSLKLAQPQLVWETCLMKLAEIAGNHL